MPEQQVAWYVSKLSPKNWLSTSLCTLENVRTDRYSDVKNCCTYIVLTKNIGAVDFIQRLRNNKLIFKVPH